MESRTDDEFVKMKSAVTYLAHLKYILLYVKEHFFVDIEFKIDSFAPQLRTDLDRCHQKYSALIEGSKCLQFACEKESNYQFKSTLYSPFKYDEEIENGELASSDSPDQQPTEFLDNLDLDNADFTDCNDTESDTDLNLQNKIDVLASKSESENLDNVDSTFTELEDPVPDKSMNESLTTKIEPEPICQIVMLDSQQVSSSSTTVKKTRTTRKTKSSAISPAKPNKRVKLEPNLTELDISALTGADESFNLDQGSDPMLQIEYWCSFEGCRFNSKSLELVKTHEEVRHIKQLLRCFQDGCDEVFDTQDDLDKHIKDVHSLILTTSVYTEVKCDIGDCDKVFANEFTLKKHLRMEHKDHYLTCRICDRKFKTRRYMTKHFRMYHPKAKKKELKKKGLADKNLKIKCTINGCDENFAKSSELKLHMRDFHKDIYLTCKFCDRVCKSRDNLTNHIWKMHQEGEFRCNHDGCDFIATVKKFLINHKKRCHPATKACPIEGCGEIIQNQNYTKHLCSKHNIKNFQCSWPDCGKTFGDKNKLKDHVRIHLNFKRFRCKWPECGYASEQRYTVITHVRVCHFKLPRTKKKQLEMNLPYDDEQNPNDYVEASREDICI